VLVGALAALTAAAVAATGTKVFLGDGGTLRSDTDGLAGRLDPAPRYRQLAQATARDPRGREPWGLRVFHGATGDTCVVLGRVVDGRLGVIRRGQFRELPTRTGGVCAPLASHHIIMTARHYAPATIADGRTAVYGIVDRTVTSLRIRHDGGMTEPLRIAPDGTFVVVRAGRGPFAAAALVATGSAGRQVRPLGG
jgi:hypothetical protein